MSQVKLTIDMDDYLLEELKERSIADGCTVSELIAVAVYEYFQAIEDTSEDNFLVRTENPNERDPSKH